MDSSENINPRLETLERKIELVKYPIVHGNPVVPPVGTIADFISDIADPAVAMRARLDTLPIPESSNREGYGATPAQYWLSGLQDYDAVVNALGEFSIREGRLYDFGGSTGRFFRHVVCQTDAFEVWTSDFKVAHYKWNQQYMPTEVRTFLNGVYPPLPLPEQHFDVITAFSVFTHIDELESPWLLELRRILRPGGLLYVTIHDEENWKRMSDSVRNAIQLSPNGKHITSETPFPAERTAFHFTDESFYTCNVFHPYDYIHREWGRFFTILGVRPLHHFAQCVVLLTY
jgi:SAM-dependent methyltransferase